MKLRLLTSAEVSLYAGLWVVEAVPCVVTQRSSPLVRKSVAWRHKQRLPMRHCETIRNQINETETHQTVYPNIVHKSSGVLLLQRFPSFPWYKEKIVNKVEPPQRPPSFDQADSPCIDSCLNLSTTQRPLEHVVKCQNNLSTMASFFFQGLMTKSRSLTKFDPYGA